MWMGQQSKDFALPEERLASEENSEGPREEWATPSTGRLAQNPATAIHIKLGLMKNFAKAMDLSGSAFNNLAEKFPWLGESKIQEGGFVDLQIRKNFIDDIFNNLLQVDEKKFGTRSVCCQLTSSGISGQKTTRNWLRTCHCITNLIAIYP